MLGIVADGFCPSAEDDLPHAHYPTNQPEFVLDRTLFLTDYPKRYRRARVPQPVSSERNLRLRHAGTCSCCGNSLWGGGPSTLYDSCARVTAQVGSPTTMHFRESIDAARAPSGFRARELLPQTPTINR